MTAQGTLEPKEYVDVGAQVSGMVEKLLDIGDVVKVGDLIAEIDPDVYEAQVKASEAELKVLEAQKAGSSLWSSRHSKNLRATKT